MAPLHPRRTPTFHPRRPYTPHLRDLAGFVVRVDFGPAFKSSQGRYKTAIAARAAACVARTICVWWRLLPGRRLPSTLRGPMYRTDLSARPFIVRMGFVPPLLSHEAGRLLPYVRVAAFVLSRTHALMARAGSKPRPAYGGALAMQGSPYSAENLPSLLDPSTRDRPVPSMGRHAEVEQHTSCCNIVVIISR